MNVDIEELKRRAEAATPGPWVSHPKGYYGAVCTSADMSDWVAVAHGNRRGNVLANEAYIAAANPAAILELIRQRDELLEALREIAEWTERYTTPGHPISTVARAAIAKVEG